MMQQKTSDSAGSNQLSGPKASEAEVQSILADPIVRQIIQEFQTNAEVAQKTLQKHPNALAKIQTLIASGVLKTG